MDPREDQKRAAAQAAAELVSEGSRVGLGSGSTVAHVLARLARRKVAPTPDGNLIVDFLGKVEDREELASLLSEVPGVVDHGLFPPDLVSEVLVGRADGSVERKPPS